MHRGCRTLTRRPTALRSRLPLLAGIIILVLWLGGLSWFQPAPLVDEAGHQLAVERIQRG